MKYVITVVLALIVNILAFMAGLLLGIPAPSYLIYVGYGLIVLLLLLSFFSRQNLKKKMDMSNVELFRTELMKSQADARANYEAYQAEVTKSIRLSILWIGACAFSAILLAFFTGIVSVASDDLPIMSLMIALYILFGFFFWLLPTKPTKYDASEILSREEYPEFYKIADEVFCEPAFTKNGSAPTLLTDGSSHIAIMREQGKIYIVLGAAIVSTLNRDELKSIFLHEKAHILADAKDPQTLGKKLLYNHEQAGTEFPISIIGDYMLFGPLLRLEFITFISDTFINVMKEQAADQYAISHGNAAAFASGLAKTYMYNLFEDNESDYLIRYFSHPTVPVHQLSDEMQLFKNYAMEHKDFWLDLISNELPAQIDSHPTFGQRMQTAGNPSFDIDFSVMDAKDPYALELKKLLANADEQIYEMNRDSYAATHEENWVKPLKVIEKFEKDLASGKKFSTLEMRPVLDACVMAMEYEKLEKYCRMCINQAATRNEAAHASFLLGTSLLKHYDKAGLPYLYAAADENHNYTEEAYDMIGKFCLLMNLPEELAEYRSRSIKAEQEVIDLDIDELSYIRRSDKLSKEEILPKEQQEKNIAHIKAVCEGHLLHLYQIHKEINAQSSFTAYVLQFKPDTSEDDMDECYEHVFQYLDNEEAQYSLFIFDHLYGFKKGELDKYIV